MAGDTFENIVATKCEVVDPKITWQEVALYNWGTQEPEEVARALVEILGVRSGTMRIRINGNSIRHAAPARSCCCSRL